MDMHRELEASLIYDKAVHVGYPALPMDVGRAEALIASAAYTRHHLSESLHRWSTKLYHNTITHIMDDSRRPDVPVFGPAAFANVFPAVVFLLLCIKYVFLLI